MLTCPNPRPTRCCLCMCAPPTFPKRDEGRSVTSVGEIYVGPIQNGGYAVVFFNRKGSAVTMTLSAADVGASAGSAGAGGRTETYWKVRDLWTHTNNGTLSTDGVLVVTVPATDAVMITLMPTQEQQQQQLQL